MKPMNTPLQWALFLLTFAFFAVNAVRYADATFPDPDPTWRVTCPNYDSVRVYRVDWASRSNVYTKTIPATCGDTTAVTFGYLR